MLRQLLAAVEAESAQDGRIGVIMFLLSEVTVLPHSAKDVSSNAENAHATNETDIQTVLPERTAPSQIIASKFLSGLDGHHQESTRSCFSEKLSKCCFAFTHTHHPAQSTRAAVKRREEIRIFSRRSGIAQLAKSVERLEPVEKFDLKSPPFGRLISDTIVRSSFSISDPSGSSSDKMSLTASATLPKASLR